MVEGVLHGLPRDDPVSKTCLRIGTDSRSRSVAKSVAKSEDFGPVGGHFPLRLPLEPLGGVGSNPSLSATGS
jgi:hypothetical protein